MDRLEWSRCFQLIDELKEDVDVVEVGTGVIKEYGMAIIREIRKRHPTLPLVADMKICDAGRYEAAQALDAGADYVTVMAFASLSTIREAHREAMRRQKHVMIDLLGMTDRNKIDDIAAIGCTHFCLHLGKDEQMTGVQAGRHLLEPVKHLGNIQISLAGGINERMIHDVLQWPIHQLIIGSAITSSENPKAAAKRLKQLCQIV